MAYIQYMPNPVTAVIGVCEVLHAVRYGSVTGDSFILSCGLKYCDIIELPEGRKTRKCLLGDGSR